MHADTHTRHTGEHTTDSRSEQQEIAAKAAVAQAAQKGVYGPPEALAKVRCQYLHPFSAGKESPACKPASARL
jgi:hypothetical protein